MPGHRCHAGGLLGSEPYTPFNTHLVSRGNHQAQPPSCPGLRPQVAVRRAGWRVPGHRCHAGGGWALNPTHTINTHLVSMGSLQALRPSCLVLKLQAAVRRAGWRVPGHRCRAGGRLGAPQAPHPCRPAVGKCMVQGIMGALDAPVVGESMVRGAVSWVWWECYRSLGIHWWRRHLASRLACASTGTTSMQSCVSSGCVHVTGVKGSVRGEIAALWV